MLEVTSHATPCACFMHCLEPVPGTLLLNPVQVEISNEFLVGIYLADARIATIDLDFRIPVDALFRSQDVMQVWQEMEMCSVPPGLYVANFS